MLIDGLSYSEAATIIKEIRQLGIYSQYRPVQLAVYVEVENEDQREDVRQIAHSFDLAIRDTSDFTKQFGQLKH